ncbi:MAG: pectic acid lyase [Planctomycetaceae bacterium]|nr:pectic acid lyase [Planctomycetaceae bacterium]
MRSVLLSIMLVLAVAPVLGQADDDVATLREQALVAMRRSTAYFTDHVALRGGYVYYYSLDLQTRWGEGRASETQVWVQPPGTPAVGLAYLAAYDATGEQQFLDAATATAQPLLFGQLKSGGWSHAIDFDPKGGRSGDYRNGQGRGKNYSTLDDSTTQTALLFLMRLDQAHQFKQPEIHEAAQFGLEALLKAQFPNGAFPQVWAGPVADQPVLPAAYPKYDWKTEHRIKEYWNLYTLNDDLAGDITPTLLAAAEIYNDERPRTALRKLGDFLILAQMPEPQPAWAQQYNYDMHPCWARKFEPPAITGHESQDAIRTLMAVYRLTGDEKYLRPIPAALKYLRSCELSDGQLARFYELRTNRPLYMTKDYQLTYDDASVPTHYGWKQRHQLDKLEQEYKLMQAGESTHKPRSIRSLSADARKILRELDDQGRWVSVVSGGRVTGQPKFGDVREYLSSEDFSENLTRLAEFVAASQ